MCMLLPPNDFINCGDYWKIKLYDKKGNHIANAKIDSEDVEKCKKYRWHLNVDYVGTNTIGKKRIYLHI